MRNLLLIAGLFVVAGLARAESAGQAPETKGQGGDSGCAKAGKGECAQNRKQYCQHGKDFVDKDGDGLCDNCKCQQFVDADGDGVCDEPGKGKGKGEGQGQGQGKGQGQGGGQGAGAGQGHGQGSGSSQGGGRGHGGGGRRGR